MIEEPPLLTVKRPARRPTESQIAAYRGLATAVVSDAMEGEGCLERTIRHLDGGRALPKAAAGPALTAGCGPADILALLGALKFMSPGDMVIAAFGSHQGCAVFGDRLCGMMKNAGVAGVVTDGPVRDIDGILPFGLPVWCTGLTPASPFSKGPGTVGLPVMLGGQRVETGDMVVADRDGVVVVPFDRIDDVAERAARIVASETSLEKEIEDGLIVPQDIEVLLGGDHIRWVE